MKDCEGCGYTFLTDRGCPGNIYCITHILHVCSYCKQVTVVEFAETRKSRPS